MSSKHLLLTASRTTLTFNLGASVPGDGFLVVTAVPESPSIAPLIAGSLGLARR